VSGTFLAHLGVAESLRLHPNSDVQAGNRCLKVARTIAGQPWMGKSAIASWHLADDKYKHPGKYVEGGISIWDHPTIPDNAEFGHAAWNARGRIIYSTDILGYGKLWRVSLDLIHDKWGLRYLGTLMGSNAGGYIAGPIAPAPVAPEFRRAGDRRTRPPTRPSPAASTTRATRRRSRRLTSRRPTR
jgi:hypothetical protein